MGKKSRRANGAKAQTANVSHSQASVTIPRTAPIPATPTIPSAESLQQSREKADSLMALFSEFDRNIDRWNPQRVNSLVSFYEIVFNMHVQADKMLKNARYVKDVKTGTAKLACLPASESPFDNDRLDFYKSRDKKFLKSIACENDEPILFRAIARALLSQYYWYRSRDENDRVKAWDDTISLCNSVTEEEAKRRFVYKESPTSVGSFLNQLGAEIQCYFKVFAGTTMTRLNNDTHELDWFASIPGVECDGCQRKRSELQVSTLRVCSVCQLTYYCSKECQRHHYKKHKHQCRGQGDFRPGDYAEMKDDDGSWKSTIKVRLLRIIPNTIEWVVAGVACESVFPGVNASNLRRIRPALWGALGMKEICMLLDAKTTGDDDVIEFEPDFYELYYAPSPCGQFSGEDLEELRESWEQTSGKDPAQYYTDVIQARKEDAKEPGLRAVGDQSENTDDSNESDG